jgi:phosphoribosylformylglycinamidine cyclo-ligase
LFELIRRRGKIERGEMDRTFNCGIGYVMVVAAKDADALVAFLAKRAVPASVIGTVCRGARGVRYSAGDRSRAG